MPPKVYKAEPSDAVSVERHLHGHGLAHLTVRSRGAILTIESGPPDDRMPHARSRRVGVHLWQLEMATHQDRWETTPFRAPLNDLLDMLISNFGWLLADRGF